MGRASKRKAARRGVAQRAAGHPTARAPMWSSNTWKLGVAGVGTLLLAGLIALLVVSSSSDVSGGAGKPAPGFTLRTIEGERFSLADQRGKVVVLEFLQPGCPSCSIDVAGLSQVATGEEGDVAVLIADISGLGARSLRDYYRGELGAPSELLVAPDAGGATAQAYGARTLGDTAIIDREGRVSSTGRWARNRDQLLERIEGAGARIAYRDAAPSDRETQQPEPEKAVLP